jgi:transcriptional regulator
MNIDKIKYLRDELEITQEEISKILGCTRTAYSLWEINKNTIPLYYLNKISNVYNINIDYLVDLSNEKYVNFEKVEIDRIKLGRRIREARKSINFTQEKLASKLNTTHSVISAYESGKSTASTLFIIDIAKITNKSLNWLLGKIQ